jgi:hypothetical protein
MVAQTVRDGALRPFYARAKLAPNSSAALAGNREAAGETFIRVHGVRGLPAGVGLFLALILTLSCGGWGGETTVTPPATPAATTPATAGAETTVGSGQAETVRDVPFSLNTDEPVPPDFAESYNRRALNNEQINQ